MGDVRLNRPDKLNALDGALVAALVEAARPEGRRPVRAVVLSGEGRAFCAGLDFAAFQTMAGAPGDRDDGAGAGAGRPGSRAWAGGSPTSDSRRRVAGLAVPVVAAITGPCLGGGLQIAMGADIRLVAADAQLSVLEMRWGLIPDMTGTGSCPGSGRRRRPRAHLHGPDDLG